MNTIFIVVPILTVLMFDLGLTLKLDDFGRVIREPRAMIVALLGQIVLLPLISTVPALTVPTVALPVTVIVPL